MVAKLIGRIEGGEIYSATLRRLYAEYHGVEVGMYSYGCFTIRDIPAGTTIGRYCSFAPGVVVFNANHPFDRRSLHPFFYNPGLRVVDHETVNRGRIDVGHDVWIGRNALISPRVCEIGNGAVVGAGAVVTKNVPPYAVVAGNPARILRYRFPPEIRLSLEESKWWEHSIDDLREHLEEYTRPLLASAETVNQDWH